MCNAFCCENCCLYNKHYHTAWLFMQLCLFDQQRHRGSLYRAIINAVFIGWSCGTDGNWQWQWESGAYMMHLATSCQLQHIVLWGNLCSTSRLFPRHIFTIKFCFPKISVSPWGTPSKNSGRLLSMSGQGRKIDHWSRATRANDSYRQK